MYLLLIADILQKLKLFGVHDIAWGEWARHGVFEGFGFGIGEIRQPQGQYIVLASKNKSIYMKNEIESS
jgi:hypothetical protein